VDDGVEEGQEVPIYYDPMLAKLVVHAPDRASAIDRCIRAIDEYEVAGVYTTLDFGRFAIDHEAFRSGQFDTHFVDAHFTPESLDRNSALTDEELASLAVGLISKKSTSPAPSLQQTGSGASPWRDRAKR
jgi:propionyl-CoA carboxylase alpha chain